MKHFSKHNSINHKTKQFPKRSMPGGSLPCDAVYTHTHTSAYLNSAVTAVALHPPLTVFVKSSLEKPLQCPFVSCQFRLKSGVGRELTL